jgi:hypothetical protein
MAVGTGLLSKNIKLGYSAVPATTYTDLDDLMEIPEIGATVEKVEVTTLVDGTKRYINGVGDYGDLAFKFLYNNNAIGASFRVLKGFEGTLKSWQITLPDGTKFAFTGTPNVKLDSAGVNAPLTYTLEIAINSAMVITNPA